MAEREIVVGIDFGTTHTGVSWTRPLRDPEGDIHIINTWKDPRRANSNKDKLPSEIIYADQTLWGFYAKHNFPKMVPLRWLKVLLDEEHMQEGMDGEAILRSTKEELKKAGKSAEDVITDYLTLVWDYALKEVQKHYYQSDVRKDFSFRIVVTVPAIWNPSAVDKTKKLVETAVSKAGLNEVKILAVNEPTAAAIATLTEMMKSEPEIVQKGDCYLVCDAGGGTVDLISYEVTSIDPLVIQPIVKANGRVCGSILLDTKFWTYMREVRLGPKIFDQLSPTQQVRMMSSFEDRIKTLFKYHLKGNESYEIDLSGIPAGEGIDTVEGTVCLSHDTLKSIFNSVCFEINTLISDQKLLVEDKNKTIRTILLVGGFGMSVYLWDFLRAKYEPEIRVFQPGYGLTAVCRGATMYGVDVSKAEARPGYTLTVPSNITHFSLGVKDTDPIPWDRKLHGNLTRKQHHITGDWVVKDQMIWLVQYGDRISHDHIAKVRLCRYIPVEQDWTTFLDIFRNKTVTFTEALYYSKLRVGPDQYSEETVLFLCEVRVKLPWRKLKSEKIYDKHNRRKKYYKIVYDGVLELGHHSLTFRLQDGDRVYGTIEQDLDESLVGPPGSSSQSST